MTDKLNFCIAALLSAQLAVAQGETPLQGFVFNAATNIKLAQVAVLNKRTLAQAKTNMCGVFTVPSKLGDTIQLSTLNYQPVQFVVADYTDKMVYMERITELQVATIQSSTLISDIAEVKSGYRKKGVFYT